MPNMIILLPVIFGMFSISVSYDTVYYTYYSFNLQHKYNGDFHFSATACDTDASKLVSSANKKKVVFEKPLKWDSFVTCWLIQAVYFGMCVNPYLDLDLVATLILFHVLFYAFLFSLNLVKLPLCNLLKGVVLVPPLLKVVTLLPLSIQLFSKTHNALLQLIYLKKIYLLWRCLSPDNVHVCCGSGVKSEKIILVMSSRLGIETTNLWQTVCIKYWGVALDRHFSRQEALIERCYW